MSSIGTTLSTSSEFANTADSGVPLSLSKYLGAGIRLIESRDKTSGTLSAVPPKK